MRLIVKLLVLFIFIGNYCLASKYSFIRLAVEKGLSNNEVNAIYKDSHGFIWFGTLRGLDRFDGAEIKPYTDKFSEPVENILSIEEDSRNTIWVGASGALFQYKQDLDRFVKVPLNMEVVINVIKSVHDKLLYIGTEQGLIIFNTETEKSEQILLDPDPESERNSINDILVDNHGSCWLATQKGLVRISVDDHQINNYYFESDRDKENNNFTAMCTLGNSMYLGTANAGVVEFDLNTKIFTKKRNIDDLIVTTIASDEREKLYIGTNGSGLIIINLRTDQIEFVEKEENDPRSLSSNSIYSFLLDENKRLWIGTYSGGVSYSNTLVGGFQLHPISTDYASINKSLRSFYFSPDGNSYFGTRNGFVHLDNKNELTLFRDDNSVGQLRSNIILTVFPFNNEILIGTYGGGVSSYNPANNKISSFLNDRFQNSNNYAFAKDKEDRLWIASFTGIYRYQQGDGSLINYNVENSELISDKIFYLTFDSKDRLWVGTDKGVYAYNFDGDSIKTLVLPIESNNSYKTNFISEDQAGNIWVCTETGGLFLFDDKLESCQIFKQKDGLPDNSVCAIVENSPGSFWISTLRGFCHFSLNETKFKNYSISDGLPGLVFSPAAAYVASDGQLWFGNENGLVGFYPENVEEKTRQSNIVITNLYIAGKNIMPGETSILDTPIEYTEEIVLDYKSNNIGFRFVDLNYFRIFDNNYFTWLEGYESDWHNNGSSNTIYYEQLKPGKYIFKVKNVVSAGEEASSVKELKIVVKQAFTRSIFFWLGLFLIFLAISFYLYRIIKKLRKIQKEYNREHEEIKKYQSSGLNQQDLINVVEKIKRYIKSEKAYLNAELKLSDVAKELNIPSHHISQALNQLENQSFSDFINKYRVREVRYMLENDAQQRLTLMAIAKQCGFNSKTSFYRVFKKFTGKTPIDYVDSLKT